MAEAPNPGRNFADYYAATREGPPRPTLLRALAAFDAEPPPTAPRMAVDLGCGTGRDTIELLKRGWRVLAVDAEADALAQLERRSDVQAFRHRLNTKATRFDALDIPHCALVNSSFALPLCSPEAFPGLWHRLRAGLNPGGRIACQLFGPRDSWSARQPPVTIHSRAEIETLMTGWEIEKLDEEETDTVTPRGRPKHWHIFHIVARKS